MRPHAAGSGAGTTLHRGFQAKFPRLGSSKKGDDVTALIAARAMQMSAFAARANAVLPPALAARLAFQQGRASKSRTMSSKAVPEGLSDGCKGAPVPEGVKLPIMAD